MIEQVLQLGILVIFGIIASAIGVYTVARLATLAYFHSLRDYRNIISRQRRVQPNQVKGA